MQQTWEVLPDNETFFPGAKASQPTENPGDRTKNHSEINYGESECLTESGI